jgi:thioredoxin-dependent peroxiredoxin
MNIFKIAVVLVLLALLTIGFLTINTGDDPPKVGDEAPEFKLVSNEGNEVSLSDYRGQWVVLYFYPKDFTSGCTIQAHNFQRDQELYHEKNAVILGVSVDTAESHAGFCAKEGLEFKLLSDIGGGVSGAYGSVRGAGKTAISARNTFVISPEGVIAKIFMKVDPNPHSAEVLSALAELQAD